MSDCILVRANMVNGYRMIHVAKVRVYAHRHALEKKLGRPIRSGYQALHTCNRKNCVNQDHLYEGTPKDNTQDSMAAGIITSRWGKNRSKKPLTEP